MSVIKFFVEGQPVAQPRPRHAPNGHVYHPRDHKIHGWRAAIQAACPRPKELLDGPIDLMAVFYFAKPKRLKVKKTIPHTSKPDLDNLVKALKDSLNKVAWVDDCKIANLSTSKWYHVSNQAGVAVQIKPLEEYL